jgi:nitrous oxidase accessory protein
LLSANGIHCWKSDSLIIQNNYVSGHRDGIYFEFVTGSSIENNTSVKNVRYGLHFMFSHHNSYIGNTFQNNGAGVAVMYSNHVTMLNNRFLENWGNAAYGILLKDISDSKIKGNLFERNTCGIFLEGSNRIQMISNRFKGNGWAMQIQANCDDNVITHNNFLGNSFDIGTNGDLVLSKFELNFWDHYTGYDLNKDGIGDVPFRPVSMYSVIIESNPASLMLYRSLLVQLLDQAERMVPGITPVSLLDPKPKMKAYKL